MELKFDKIEILKKIENRRKYTVLSLFSIPILGLLLQPKSSSFLTYIIVGLFIVDIVIIFLYRALVKRYEVKGNVILSKNFIQVADEIYSINNLKEILIFYSGYKGESHTYARFGVNQLSLKDGASNRLLLKMNSKEDVEISFLSTMKSDLARLKQMLQYYYDNGIDVKIKRI